MDTRLDTGLNPCADTNNVEGLEQDIELTPLDDVTVVELPISEQEMAELLDEVEALDLQPFEETEAIDPAQEMPIDYDAVFETY